MKKHYLLSSQTFKALSDPTRIRILHLLFHGEHSVNEIAEKLGLLQSTVSHQLRFLKNLRLVKFRREGTTLFYTHDDEHVMDILEKDNRTCPSLITALMRIRTSHLLIFYLEGAMLDPEIIVQDFLRLLQNCIMNTRRLYRNMAA